MREDILLLLKQCDIPYQIVPLDADLYQECIDDAIRRGYPVDGDWSVRTYLRQGVAYAANAGMHLPRHPTQIWIALFTSCAIFVDEMADHFPEEMPSVYLFNDRFVRAEPQGNNVLDALADIVRRVSDLYPPVPSQLITTAALNFVTANLLEHETKSMKVTLSRNHSEGHVTDDDLVRFRTLLISIPLTNESYLASREPTRSWHFHEKFR